MRRSLGLPVTLSVTVALLLGATLAGAWTLDTTLADADGSYVGEVLFDYSGVALALVGDVDGDGFDDFVVGTPWNDDSAPSAGQTYLVLGTDAGWVSEASLGTAAASFLGEAAYDEAGAAVAAAGDVDHDGYADFLIGAYANDAAGSSAGAAYLIYGDASGWALHSDLAATSTRTRFTGEADQDHAGRSVAGVGDVNDDGWGDVLIGAEGNDEAGNSAGQSYLVLGGPAAAHEVQLAHADASYWGELPWDLSGSLVAGAADVDGDHFDDMLISAPGSDLGGNYAGQVYLVRGGGSLSMDISLTGADASFVGENANDYAGEAMAGVGDVDGDGLDDIVIGAWGNSDAAIGAGKVYLVFGRTAGWSMGMDLGGADATFLGEHLGDEAGGAVSAAGDVNADGLADFLVGAWGSDDGALEGGEAYLLLGRTSGWNLDADLASSSASFVGEHIDDLAGSVVSGGGDLDGDGLDDLLVGSSDSDAAATDAGQTYVLLGRDFCVDLDGDGYGMPGSPLCPNGADDDCDDGDVMCYPGALELCDGLDNDCDGALWADEADDDGDGYRICEDDCDDGDASRHPGAAEACDGLDTNCDNVFSLDELDNDGDGWMVCAGDCDDGDAGVSPDATEICDGVDTDCNGTTPPVEDDEDADGYMVCEDDCDDTDAAINPAGTEACNGVDDDCDGAIPVDELDDDLDGFMVCEDDCDDGDDAIHPDAVEVCNGVDDDCDGAIPADEADTDADGFMVCEDDCDDTEATVHPGMGEMCDGLDNDCDGAIPDDEADADADGWRVCEDDCDDADAALNLDDADADGVSTCEDDCDDAEPLAWPGNEEDCDDEVDNDCDGDADAYDLEDCAPTDDDDDDDFTGDDDDTTDEPADDDIQASTTCECRVGGRGGAGVSGVLLLALLLVWRRTAARISG
jgi:hypothetical protein